jgi:hypothetical protein
MTHPHPGACGCTEGSLNRGHSHAPCSKTVYSFGTHGARPTALCLSLRPGAWMSMRLWVVVVCVLYVRAYLYGHSHGRGYVRLVAPVLSVECVTF